MFYGIRTLPHRFRLLLSSFQQDESLSFSDTLTQDQRGAAQLLGRRGADWRHAGRFWATTMRSEQRPLLSRSLPLALGGVRTPTLDVAARCEAKAPEGWLWKGRHAKLIDGTTVTMPDTEENQEAFPQQSCQKEGLGFPIARLVVVISLATAMVNGMSMGPYQGKETGEHHCR